MSSHLHKMLDPQSQHRSGGVGSEDWEGVTCMSRARVRAHIVHMDEEEEEEKEEEEGREGAGRPARKG